MTHPLETASAALVERLMTESDRPAATADTHRIGGVAKVAAKLDDFLLELLVEVSSLTDRAPEHFLQRPGSKPLSLRRSTAGQRLYALRDAANSVSDLPPGLGLWVDDARGSVSVLWKVVELRNVAVHQSTLPANALESLAELCAMLVKYRREMGWAT